MIPKVIFNIVPVADYFEFLYEFLTPEEGWDWSERIYEVYPDIREVTDKQQLLDYFEETLLIRSDVITESQSNIEGAWRKIEQPFFETISDIVEIDWPKNAKKIYARITLNPICPRFIQERTFDLFYQKPIDEALSTIMHECLHFIYFEKWKEIFPETPEEEFETPHLVWHLSEMVPAIILNEPRIQAFFDHDCGVYEEYEKAVIDGKPLLSYLQEMYDARENFEDFLRKAYAFVQKYEKEIKSLS